MPVRRWQYSSTSGVSPSRPSLDPDAWLAWLFNDARTEEGGFPKWDYLEDYARQLATREDLVVLKRRQILVSWVTGAWYHYVASRFPYHHGAVVSAGKTASNKQGRRIVTVARRDGYDVHGVDLIKYPSGSEITILPSTEHAGVGESMKLGAHFDEYDFHPYARQNLGTIQPAVSNSGGQTIITSTANPKLGAMGPFHELWYGEASGQRLFYGKHSRPDQEAAFFEAEARKPGMNLAVMQAFYPETPDEAFVAHEGLVYGLDKDGHPIFGAHNIKPARCNWTDNKWRLGGVDFGGRDPTAVHCMGISVEDRAHIYAPEFYQRGAPTAEEIGSFLFRMHNVAPFNAIVCDPSAANMIATLRAMGLPVMAANNDKAARIAAMKQVLKDGRLTIAEACTNLINEFKTYWYAERKDMQSGGVSAVETRTPASHHADGLDEVGYMVLAWLNGIGRGAERVQVVYR